MGASEWAGRTIEELNDEFGIKTERSLRITNLIRHIVSDPSFEDLREAIDIHQTRFQETFINSTVESLKNQSGESVEERWNNLVDDFGLLSVAGEALILHPPEKYILQLIPLPKHLNDQHELSLADFGPQNTVEPSEKFRTYYYRRRNKKSSHKPGWTNPPESVNGLHRGQLLRVVFRGSFADLAIVLRTSDNEAYIRPKISGEPFKGDEITVIDVEDVGDSDKLQIPKWAEEQRESL